MMGRRRMNERIWFNLRFDYVLQSEFSLSIDEPVNQMTGHFWCQSIKFEKFTIIPQRPGRTQFQSERDCLIVSIVVCEWLNDCGQIWNGNGMNEKLCNANGATSVSALTKSVFRENVIQNAVSRELLAVVATKISVQHFQLSLTLIKFFVIALFHCNACMRFVHLNGELVANTLNLWMENRNESYQKRSLGEMRSKRNGGTRKKRAKPLTVRSCRIDLSWSHA